ncbi:zinc-binding alcohol dehydrogenase family protein [Novosphingobium terrae]|uniref:zinc-binding alcohol dehydrogenase family protein n=1 Tax=Novosphingobium terrae TaxID=2726189 RepID=UPI0019811136|nr:zinc-binding alcohol dehydrogenase family protein [Novosphingobium terrae]
MKAIICEEPFKLAIEERPVPHAGPGEALVRICRVGLCGTDYHIFKGNQPFLAYPRVMGHELAGEIVEAPKESGLTPGDRVTINPYLPCGDCKACRLGKPNCCCAIRVLGVHMDGGMSEIIAVPLSAVIAVPGLALDQAAMVEFLAVGAHAVRRGMVRAGETVLVVGAGPIGVGVALFARIAGARVLLADTSAQRLAHARDRIGAAPTCLVGEHLAADLAEWTGGDFFDCVFDATGNSSAIEQGFNWVAHGGRYVLVSVVKDRIRFSDPEFHKREMMLIGSRNALREDFEQVIACMMDGSLPSADLHTHSFELKNLENDMPNLLAMQGSVMKAIGRF